MNRGFTVLLLLSAFCYYLCVPPARPTTGRGPTRPPIEQQRFYGSKNLCAEPSRVRSNMPLSCCIVLFVKQIPTGNTVVPLLYCVLHSLSANCSATLLLATAFRRDDLYTPGHLCGSLAFHSGSDLPLPVDGHISSLCGQTFPFTPPFCPSTAFYKHHYLVKPSFSVPLVPLGQAGGGGYHICCNHIRHGFGGKVARLGVIWFCFCLPKCSFQGPSAFS